MLLCFRKSQIKEKETSWEKGKVPVAASGMGWVDLQAWGTPAEQHAGLEEARVTGPQADACSAGDQTPASLSSSGPPEAWGS